jgi:hypothetical protein
MKKPRRVVEPLALELLDPASAPELALLALLDGVHVVGAAEQPADLLLEALDLLLQRPVALGQAVVVVELLPDLGRQLDLDLALQLRVRLLQVEQLVLEGLRLLQLGQGVRLLGLGAGRLRVEVDQTGLQGVLLPVEAVRHLLPVTRLLLHSLSLLL